MVEAWLVGAEDVGGGTEEELGRYVKELFLMEDACVSGLDPLVEKKVDEDAE